MNTFSKQPSETYTIGIEFAGKLPTGATIVSGTVSAKDQANIDQTATVLSGTSATILGTEALIKVLAGTHGQNYRIKFLVTLSTSDLLEEDVLMRVANE